jgi:enoyl-CoA hydratase/carnithine racemase
MQMLMTGEPISAQEAHRLGMVNQVSPQEDHRKVSLEIAEKIARNSPTCGAGGQALFQQCLDLRSPRVDSADRRSTERWEDADSRGRRVDTLAVTRRRHDPPDQSEAVPRVGGRR